ncbi:hypothetical protein OIU76_030255 [Salix suchowensis]|nr:hypothetical protein OIU76_030255 [Salix suchowensis]
MMIWVSVFSIRMSGFEAVLFFISLVGYFTSF